MFEGDAALRELRTRLAAVPADEAPEPPVTTPAKTPIFGSAMRLMGVVGLAAGGALGFLWITSPHGPHSMTAQSGEEVALVSLRGVEPSKSAQPNIAASADQMPDPSPAANAPPFAVANYTGDTAEKAVTPPAVPQPFTGGPPSAPVAHIASPPPVQPAMAPPPGPGSASVRAALATPMTPPAVISPPSAPAAAASLDRDEVNAMLARARTFLASGDVAAARVILHRAAEHDDAQAALALGGTYDPTVLRKLGIMGYHHADAAQAREWYQKAVTLGSADASVRLQQMTDN